MAGASKPPLSSWLGFGGQEAAADAVVAEVAIDATERARPEATRVSAMKSRSALERRREDFRIRQDYDSTVQ